MQEILNQFKGGEYVFPILSERHGTPQQKHYRIIKSLKIFNKNLKKLGEVLGFDMKLTSYVARHSWATVMKREGVSTSIISEGLGHRTELTTQIYLDSFENSVLDEASKKAI